MCLFRFHYNTMSHCLSEGWLHCILRQDVEGANREWAAVQEAALPFERILEVGASRVEVLASAGEPLRWITCSALVLDWTV